MNRWIIMMLLGLVAAAHGAWQEDAEEAWTSTREAVVSAAHRAGQAVNDLWVLRDRNEEARRQADIYQEKWPEFLELMEEASEIRADREDLPERRLFGADKESRNRELQKIFGQINDLLGGDKLHAYRDKLERTEDKISHLKAGIRELEEARIGADEQGRARIETRIQEKRKGIDAARSEIELHRAELQGVLLEYGVDLAPEQMDLLLLRVDYGDVITLASTIHAARTLTGHLLQLMEQGGREDIEAARRYYGMHLVLVELMVVAHRGYADKIQQQYLPKVESIAARAGDLRADARRGMKGEEDTARKEAYGANMAANQVTMEAAARYASLLMQQQRQVESSLQRLERDYDLAENTYRTVQLSADLLAVISRSSEEFLALAALDVPQLVPFENRELERAFAEITEQMKAR